MSAKVATNSEQLFRDMIVDEMSKESCADMWFLLQSVFGTIEDVRKTRMVITPSATDYLMLMDRLSANVDQSKIGFFCHLGGIS